MNYRIKLGQTSQWKQMPLLKKSFLEDSWALGDAHHAHHVSKPPPPPIGTSLHLPIMLSYTCLLYIILKTNPMVVDETA